MRPIVKRGIERADPAAVRLLGNWALRRCMKRRIEAG